MRRLLVATAVSLTALTAPAVASTIQAKRETTHFRFNARPHRIETECEPTSARAVLFGSHAERLPQLFDNTARNGTVYVFERHHNTCASIVNWTNHRERVHFTIILLDTQTRLP